MNETLEPALSSLLGELQAMARASGQLPWASLRPGVDIFHVFGHGPAEAGAALLRYAPGATIPAHEHIGYEQIYVITGWQRDERARYDAGTLLTSQPGSRHRVESPEGCLVFAVWERGVGLLSG